MCSLKLEKLEILNASNLKRLQFPKALKFVRVGNIKRLIITAFKNLKHSNFKTVKIESARNSKQFNSKIL